MRTLSAFVSCLFLMINTVSAQDQAVIDSLTLWEEQVYLHTDKAQAKAGEAIFFKAYIFNSLTLKRFSPSGVLRLELRDSQNALVRTQYHPIRKGVGEGMLRLPQKLKDGKYQLIAYTRWMQNYGEEQFFRKQIWVGDVREAVSTAKTSNAADITFHPEGGRLLAGIPNRLVLKTTEGTKTKLKGDILDDSGSVLVPVQPYSAGYAMTIFKPEAGKSYRFRSSEGDIWNLPGADSLGYSLRVNNLSADKIAMEVQPTEAMGQQPVILKGKRDGKTYFIHAMEFTETPWARIEIPKAQLPPGLMNFTLEGMNERVWASRLVWIKNRADLTIEVSSLGTDFTEEGTAVFKVRVTDSKGKPVQAELSVSVTRPQQGTGMNLLQFIKPRELKDIEGTERRERFAADLKVLCISAGTNGWEAPNEIKYMVQRSLELHGTAYDLNNNLLPRTEIQMLASSDSTLVIREVNTDAAGVLHLKDLNVVGETRFVFRTKGEEQNQRLVKIIPVKEAAVEGDFEVRKSRIYKKTERKKQWIETTASVPFDTTGVIQLDEATVQKRRDQQKVTPSLYGVEPNPFDVVYQDPERPLPMEVLLPKIPGIQIRRTAEGLPIVVAQRRGLGGEPLWVVDGQIIRTVREDPTYSPLNFITPLDIERIEFLIDGGQTGIFGVLGGTGVLIVYTRNGNNAAFTNRNAGGLYFKGYQPTQDFEDYLNERQSQRKYRKELPGTLYWNPWVQTDQKGEAIIRFTSPGDYQNVLLTVETLTEQGLVGSFSRPF